MFISARKNKFSYFIFLLAAYFLAGCAGNNTSTTSSLATFSTWNAVGPSTSISFGQGSGLSSSVTLEQAVSSSNNATGNLRFDSSRNLSAYLVNNGAGSSISINIANGDTILKNYGGSSYLSFNSGRTQMGILADPYYMGYEYQTYGAWGSYGSSSTSSHGYVLGNPTPAASIPTAGTGTFVGSMAGYYTDSARNGYLAFANLTAAYDFAARSLSLSTSNSAITGLPSGQTVSAPGLNMTSTLTYNANTNRLTGTVSTSNGMTGNMVGQFYGPAANEVGGTFSVQYPNIGTLVGGFGGKR